jgi:hypothetical protein
VSQTDLQLPGSRLISENTQYCYLRHGVPVNLELVNFLLFMIQYFIDMIVMSSFCGLSPASSLTLS